MGKKIFFVGNTAWSMYNFRLDVIKALKYLGHEVTVVAPEDGWEKHIIESGIPFIPIQIDNKGTSPFKDLKLLYCLLSIYRKNKPDLIFHYTIKPNIYGSLAARLCKIKSIACVTGAGSVFIKNNLVTKVVIWLFRFSFRFPSEVWFLNQEDKDLFRRYGLVSNKQMRLLPGEGIDIVKFQNREGHNAEKSNNLVILFVGRLLWDKGVGEFVEVARAIRKKWPHVHFKLLGFLDVQNPSAISKEQMNQWVSEGIVTYLGVSKDVRPAMLEADCVVLPSYREGLPRTLLEAACLEKPVITTDVPGCREVVEDEITGFLCRPKDARDLQEKIEKMIRVGKLIRNEMGKAGRRRVREKYEMKIIIEKYKDTINVYG